MRVVCLLAASLFAGNVVMASDGVDPVDFFRAKVEPLLVTRCLECHADARKGELDLRTRESALAGGEHGAAIAPGDAKNSLLLTKVFFEEMPPKHPLTDDEMDVLEAWIRDGAYYPEQPLDPFSITTNKRGGYDWWSLQPIRAVIPPSIETSIENGSLPVAWNNHPVDRFVGARMVREGLAPNPPADPRTLIRRVTYDLIGLPPTPEEVRAFEEACVQETGSRNLVGEAAYEALVDRLLASPHYGETWGRHWLDVVRFGESTGFEVNHIIDNAWPYRDYVIQSFNDDKPFDRFVLEQLAGDSVAPGDPKVEVGLTFLVCGPVDIVGNQDPAQAAQIRANDIDEMIRATSETFLGLTAGCARCHDHKFDPISTKDYYRLYATFAGVYPDSREVATDAERNARKELLEPLVSRRRELQSRRADIERAILARAEARTPGYSVEWIRPAVDRTGTEEVFEPVQARLLRLVVSSRDNDPNAATGFKLDEFEVWTADSEPRNVALATNGGTADGKSPVAEDFGDAYLPDLTIDGKFGQSWLARGPTLTISFAKPEQINRVYFSSDRLGALAPTSREAPFPCEYRIEVSVDGETWIRVADSADRMPANEAHKRKRFLNLETTASEQTELNEIASLEGEVNAEIAGIPGFPVLRVGRMKQPEGPAHVFKGGSPQRPGEAVVPSSLDVLSRTAPTYTLSEDAPERERRFTLARWIVDEENPLPARVLANRLWHYHFGTGVVTTPSDFGFMGTRPSHPDLLDWLAHELIAPADGDDQKWRIKRMHKLIVTSQSYRQAGTYRRTAAEVDGDVRYLWRFPPRRLTGEELRDSMLAVSGSLDARMGGPGFRLYHYIRDNVASYIPLDEYGPETYRRSVYHQNARASRIDLMSDFDAPDCAMSAPRRVSTTTPLQALTLMNHSFTLDMADALAARVKGEGVEGAPEEQVNRVFELVLLRKPTAAELQESKALIGEFGVRALCRAVFNSNEFLYVN